VRDLRFEFGADSFGHPLPPLESIEVDGGPFRRRGHGAGGGYLWYAARRRGIPDSELEFQRLQYGLEPPGMTAMGPTAPLV
jgi:hypothetical protein